MKKKVIIFTVFLFSAIAATAANPVQEGKEIFTTRCASCHSVNKDLTGPALAGVDQRRSIDWIINFVHSPLSMVKSGDKEAVVVYEKFNKIPMPDHWDLSADNIKSIVEYIKSESTAGVEKAPFARPLKLRPAYTPLSLSNYGFFIGYLAVVVLLVLALLFAVQLKQYERKARSDY